MRFKLIIFTLFTGVIAFFCFWKLRVEDRQYENWLRIIESDGFGYYVYLPAISHQDFDYDFVDAIDERYFAKGKGILKQDIHGNYYTKYFAGTALLMSPFYFIADAFASVTAFERDGYSLPYQWAAFLATLSYFLAGLWLFVLLLIKLGIRANLALITAFLLAFASNIGVYVYKEPCMSHVYAFFMISLIAYQFLIYLSNKSLKNTLLLALFIGLLALVRPTSILMLIALPFLAELQGQSWKTLLPKGAYYLPSIIILLLVGSIQPLFYYLQTGSPVIWSYQEEGFYFLHPEIINFLFSFRKGWFVYTPIAVLSITGLWTLWKRSKMALYWYLLFFGVVLWVLSSWWNWWYGGSFGSRSLIDFYPIVFVVVALGLSSIKRLVWIVPLSLFVVGCIGLNGIQQYQYSTAIMHYDEIDRYKYIQIFGQTDDFFRNSTHTVRDPTRIRHKYETVQINNYDANAMGWKNEFEGERLVNASNPYGPTFSAKIDSLFDRAVSDSVFLEIRVRLKPESVRSRALVVLDIKGEQNAWHGRKVMSVYRKMEGWKWCSYYFDFADLEDHHYSFETYLFSESEAKLLVDSIQVKVHTCSAPVPELTFYH